MTLGDHTFWKAGEAWRFGVSNTVLAIDYKGPSVPVQTSRQWRK